MGAFEPLLWLLAYLLCALLISGLILIVRGAIERRDAKRSFHHRVLGGLRNVIAALERGDKETAMIVATHLMLVLEFGYDSEQAVHFRYEHKALWDLLHSNDP